MADFNTDLEKYRKKKKEIITTSENKKTEKKLTGVLPGAQIEKESKKEEFSNAYSKILAADFDNAAWISKDASMRKHRKNIAKNHESLTGRKRGLSSKEKINRKKDFEKRRDISLRASMALEAFIGKSSEMDPDPSDENMLKSIEETDLSKFIYGGMGAKQEEESDAAFVEGFKDQMSELHNASLLYNKILEGEPDAVSPAIMRKLSRMNDMRQAYEDRIRIISSPYYVSLREVDFDKSTKEKLRTGDGDEKRDDILKDYAKAMIRWQESGKKLLSVKKAAAEPAPEEKVIQDDNVLAEGREYVSDQAVDKVIDKVNKNTRSKFKGMVKGDRDEPMKYTREWVYSDLKKIPEDRKMVQEVERMKAHLRTELADNTIKEHERKNKEKVLRHLDRVTAAFAAKKISSDVMRIWLDRCLQHKLSYSNEIYMTIVHQGKTGTDEEAYFHNVAESINPYVQEMSGVIFGQKYKKSGVYQRKTDIKEKNDPAMNRARRGYDVKEFSGIGDLSLGDSGDFIHINGKNADYNDTSTRVYVSAKPKYKSLVVQLFTETIAEFEHKNMRDELYFKIAVDKSNARGFATDDLTVYFGANVSLDERKQIVDKFYEKCDKMSAEKKESILDGENMTIAGSKYKDGIALAGEPEVASLLNDSFSNADSKFEAKYTDRKKLKWIDNMSGEESKAQFSFNTFVTAMLVQSTFITGHRFKTSRDKGIDTDDPKVREEIKKIFRELCFLNGINPENMAEIDSKTIFG